MLDAFGASSAVLTRSAVADPERHLVSLVRS